MSGEAVDGPSAEEWERRLRAAAGYSGPSSSEVVGERELGLADGAELARGPHIMFDMQRAIAGFGGEQGWLRRGDVGEEGWRADWQERADAARQGLVVDDAGYVAWCASGERLTVEEAAARGPAVEMATRARLALGEKVEVEQGEPAKRSGGEGEDGGGVFVNVNAARASFMALTDWSLGYPHPQIS